MASKFDVWLLKSLENIKIENRKLKINFQFSYNFIKNLALSSIFSTNNLPFHTFSKIIFDI